MSKEENFRKKRKKQKKLLYNPKSKEPYKLSRAKIGLFLDCPRCFYLDRRLGIERPQTPSFSLNTAVDTLLKKEFDINRVNKTKHPLMEKYGIDAIPFSHKDLDKWRNNHYGIQYLHKPTNLLIYGAVDDLWQNSKGELIVVEYKATAKDEEIIALTTPWQEKFKKQMEIYQWLLRKNGYKVSNTGYFVYCNGKTDREAFDGKLEFDVNLIPYEGNDLWVEETIFDIYKCLNKKKIPKAANSCVYCNYIKSVMKL